MRHNGTVLVLCHARFAFRQTLMGAETCEPLPAGSHLAPEELPDSSFCFFALISGPLEPPGCLLQSDH